MSHGSKLRPVHSVRPCPLPPRALLASYAHAGAYTDCYAGEVARAVSHAEFIVAFYTGALFRIERWLLGQFISRPSTDAQARQLAAGACDTFAAWRVERRSVDQLLMCDIAGRTRSWLMVSALPGPTHGTCLYFGSAVVPVVSRSSGRPGMGLPFKALLGFHKLYSRALLRSAQLRLARDRDQFHGVEQQAGRDGRAADESGDR